MVLTPEGPRSMQNVEILYFLSAQWSHLFILTLNFRDFFILLFGWSDPTIFLYYPSIKAYNGPWGWRGWYFRLRQIKLWIHACQPASQPTTTDKEILVNFVWKLCWNELLIRKALLPSGIWRLVGLLKSSSYGGMFKV